MNLAQVGVESLRYRVHVVSDVGKGESAPETCVWAQLLPKSFIGIGAGPGVAVTARVGRPDELGGRGGDRDAEAAPRVGIT